jgi:hypothetical protein
VIIKTTPKFKGYTKPHDYLNCHKVEKSTFLFPGKCIKIQKMTKINMVMKVNKYILDEICKGMDMGDQAVDAVYDHVR